MIASRRSFLLGSSAVFLCEALTPAFGQTFGAPTLDIDTPMAPPRWALLERELLDAHTPACQAFFDRYFDDRGYFLCIERWGADDGPDDAIENVNDWPAIYRLGGSDRIRKMYEKAYEGHVRQYTEAKTTEVPFAREGMYFREFPVMMDWQHNGEGLTVFNVMGLGDPYNPRYRSRVRRFAGFYTGEDPVAKNYDPKHKIIRSMFNGSLGPLMRKATALDWTGDPVDLSRLDLSAVLHGERNYEEMLAHFKDYTETTGDNPLNLEATTLAFNAYALSNEKKYRDWILEYVDAWVDRARRNNNMIPTNIGYDGTIGGEAGGKWYGGTYGWAFSPIVPQTGERQDRNRIPFCFLAFANAYVLTNDDKYLDVWRKQADHINANMKTIDGKPSAPYMYGDDGWYGYRPGKWNVAVQDIYMLTMKQSDRARMPDHPWVLFLEGKNPDYPAEALEAGIERLRKAGERLRADNSTPDTRFADTVMDQNPASVTPLIELMEGGIHIGRPGWSNLSPGVGGAAQYSRLRYFDPVEGRPGVPKDVAALVQKLTADSASVTLVNVNQTHERIVTIQGGAYGEHQILAVNDGKGQRTVNGRAFTVRLAPGSGATISMSMQRYANQPTLAYPWLGQFVD